MVHAREKYSRVKKKNKDILQKKKMKRKENSTNTMKEIQV